MNYVKSIFSKLDKIHDTVAIAKTKNNIPFLIRDHAFSILGVYDVHYENATAITLFYLYNPWGTDVGSNKVDDNYRYSEDAELMSQMNIAMLGANFNDGKFFVEYSTILNYVERITAFEPLFDYEIVTIKIAMPSIIHSNYILHFLQKPVSNSSSNRTFFYFNLLNENLLSAQTQPYEIANVNVYPPLHDFTVMIDENGNSDPTYSLLYKGGYYANTSKEKLENQTYSISLSVTLYDYDVADFLNIAFYAPKGSVKILNATNIHSSDCPNSCSSHGMCYHSNKTCLCFSGVFFLYF